jgi:serine protease Do
MRRYLLSVPAMVAAALILGQPASAQEKEKTEKPEKIEKVEKKEKVEKEEKEEKAEKMEKDAKMKISTNEEIVIKRKNDKDGKVTIEMKGDDIIVNGKPLEDYDDDDIIIRKRKSGTTIYSPFRGQSGTNFYNGDSRIFLDGDSKTPFLGVVTEKDDKGAKIEQITDGSAADKAGLKEGDVITKVGDDKIEDPDDLTKAVRKHKPDDKVGITYERDGKTEKTTATLGKKNMFSYNTPKFKMPDTRLYMPDMNFNWDQGAHGEGAWSMNGRPRLGIKAQDTEEGKGVKVLDVNEESAADKAGIKEGDIITEFDGKKVDNADELSKYAHEAAAAQKTSIRITFNRNGKSQTVEVKTPRKIKTTNL